MCGLRHDGERPRPLDLPHPCAQGSTSDGRLEIAPLANLPVIRDLAADMTRLFRQMGAGRRPLPAARPDAPRRIRGRAAGIASSGRRPMPASNDRLRRLLRGCDVVAWNPDYLGPAALNRAWTLVNDVRDGGAAERLAAVAGDAGCHACHSSRAARSAARRGSTPRPIAGLKRATRSRRCGPAARTHTRAAQTQLGSAQRLTAMVLAVASPSHLVDIILAVRGGLTAAEIIARPRGTRLAALLRGVRAGGRLHAPIGLRTIAARDAPGAARFDVAWHRGCCGSRGAVRAMGAADEGPKRMPGAGMAGAFAPNLSGLPGAPPLRPAAGAVPAAAFLGAGQAIPGEAGLGSFLPGPPIR